MNSDTRLSNASFRLFDYTLHFLSIQLYGFRPI